MEQSIKIRKMKLTDLESVARVYNEVFDSTYISFGELSAGLAVAPGMQSEQAAILFKEELAELLHKSSSGLFVAIDKDIVVGFAIASLRAAEAGHLECWLDDLGVSQNHRGRKIGRNLIENVLNWGNQEGVKYFLLESGLHNKAHRLFVSMGFQPLSVVFCQMAVTQINPEIAPDTKS
jgi:GNAT superfamily N-acetyltransferase